MPELYLTTTNLIDQKLKWKLRDLSKRRYGMMARQLNTPDIPVAIMHEAGRILGWALINRKGCIMFYVRATHRRRGFGTQLFDALKDHSPKVGGTWCTTDFWRAINFMRPANGLELQP